MDSSWRLSLDQDPEETPWMQCLLAMHKIKDAWRRGKTVATLFLNMQEAFPNMVEEQLIHNMRMWCIPDCFINIVTLSLTGCTTQLKFDDYILDPIPLDNRMMQGDMLCIGISLRNPGEKKES